MAWPLRDVVRYSPTTLTPSQLFLPDRISPRYAPREDLFRQDQQFAIASVVGTFVLALEDNCRLSRHLLPAGWPGKLKSQCVAPWRESPPSTHDLVLQRQPGLRADAGVYRHLEALIG